MYIYGKQIQLAYKPDFNLLIFIYFLLDAKCPSRFWVCCSVYSQPN